MITIVTIVIFNLIFIISQLCIKYNIKVIDQIDTFKV